MRRETPHQQLTQAVNQGWIVGGSFFASILSGFLLGFFADRWLDTGPWLVITGILVGAYSGFLRLWHHARREERRRGR